MDIRQGFGQKYTATRVASLALTTRFLGTTTLVAFVGGCSTDDGVGARSAMVAETSATEGSGAPSLNTGPSVASGGGSLSSTGSTGQPGSVSREATGSVYPGAAGAAGGSSKPGPSQTDSGNGGSPAGENPGGAGGTEGVASAGSAGGTSTADPDSAGGAGGSGGDTSTGVAGEVGAGGAGTEEGGVGTEGKVPMFVAAGFSARTMTSCDDGHTWIAEHLYEPSNEGRNECGNAGPCNRSHQDLTEKGLAYGNGVFMQIVGWGAGPSVKFSRNGIDWERVHIPTDIVRIDANLVFIDEPTPRFVALSGYGGACAESADGQEWTECPVVPQYSDSMREAGGGGSVIGAAGNSRAIFTFDGGQSWGTSSECGFTSQFGNLGQDGGFMWGNERFVVVNESGSWCHTGDLGSTWQTGSFGGGAVGKASFSGGRFWAPNGRTGHWSEDGTNWTQVEFKPDDVRIHAIATGDSGTLVGIERLGSTGEVSSQPARFYRSEDGENWTMSTGPAGTMFRRVVFGYGEPSEQCPAP